MLDSELKECLLRTRARGAIFVCAHKKKREPGLEAVPVSALVWYYCCPPLARGEGQMCLFYSASLKSTA